MVSRNSIRGFIDIVRLPVHIIKHTNEYKKKHTNFINSFTFNINFTNGQTIKVRQNNTLLNIMIINN